MKYIALFLLSIGVLQAQDTDTEKSRHYQMWLKPSLSINYLSVDVEDSPRNEILGNKSVLPNYPLTAGIGLGIYNTYISIDYAKSIMPLRNEHTYGKTQYFDFQLHSFFSEKYLLDLYYQSYKGFYYRHKGKVQLLEDTRIQQVGAEILYFTNWEEKSLKNIFATDGSLLTPSFSWYLGGGAYYHKVIMPLITPEKNDTFRHIQAGMSGGAVSTIELYPHLTLRMLMGLGFYLGGDADRLSQMKVNNYFNYRVDGGISYSRARWTADFSILHNNKRLFFKDNELLGINTSTFKISYIRQFGIKSGYNNKVTRLLGM